MARPTATPEEVEREVGVLADLDLYALRDRWQALFGNPPPKSLRRDFLARACAHQIRVKAFGGLSSATKRKLRAIAEAARTGNIDGALGSLRIKPGTRLVRLWQDKSHTVTATDEGFEWNGSHYGSLSAVAKAITGKNWNGYVFFGVKRAPAGNKHGSGPRPKRRVRPAEPEGPLQVAALPNSGDSGHG